MKLTVYTDTRNSAAHILLRLGNPVDVHYYTKPKRSLTKHYYTKPKRSLTKFLVLTGTPCSYYDIVLKTLYVFICNLDNRDRSWTMHFQYTKGASGGNINQL